ncbi:hypothetical protein A3754_01965 [Alcanivorax sp. HI0083]|jgi:hypothetical protein|uniref:hypothetical protein n=1 Tax=unclassified Alcanivorax TaxID=2638842 RepID=UPI0007B831E0|nr:MULTISPECIES: hypothetical protein [unclassified Alcanivorax]KZY36520.1 hypothetical protein A3730_13000 [Alcanivorax sp. HI0044]KZY39966.1 hypothetical protein A3730_23040 [Alcanivorax sp. HI0044]KZZ25954.1 hypothetical protein A3754_01965 [Alcanivorax sp. HI0083]
MAYFNPTPEQLDAMDKLGLSPKLDATPENIARIALILDVLIKEAYPDIDLSGEKKGVLSKLFKR